jgi:hypothetical protein
MKFRATSVLAILLAAVIPAFAEIPSLPSEGLDQRIDFWKKIYTQYGADDVVIHDRVYVNLIYDVANSSNQSAKIADVQNALREIRANLETPENLSPEAAPVFEKIMAQKLPLSAGFDPAVMSNSSGKSWQARACPQNWHCSRWWSHRS